MEEEEKITEVHGWRCNYCGEIYPKRELAEQCWENHTKFEFEPIFFTGEEFPVEVLVKKIEGSHYTEIATYEMKKKEKVNIPVKRELYEGTEG